MNHRYTMHPHPRRVALATALAMGLGVTGMVSAQSTSGTIFGSVPVDTGETVTVSSSNGVSREIPVGTNGRFSIGNLALGTYKVTLRKDGQVVDVRDHVDVRVGAGVEVNFVAGTGQDARDLSAVQVTATALPTIDVTSVNSQTVITAQELQKLPVGRNAESIALLAPGAVAGSGYFPRAVSFGGSSVSENAYYVNGFNTSEPYRNIGGFQLPYGSIDQQQTFTGGYSAQYGRSDGGVINQVGKRGTDEWHFGGQVVWSPRSLAAGPKNTYYPHQDIPDGWGIDNANLPGTIHHYKNDNRSWETIYSAYVGGPLIEHKLYAFISAETSKNQYGVVDPIGYNTHRYFSAHDTHMYAKLDWNIDDNNTVELTSLTSDSTGNAGNGKGSTYKFDYDSMRDGVFQNANDAPVNDAKFLIAKYTSYISDNATLNILWGKGDFKNSWEYANNSKNPPLRGLQSQNPAYLPPGRTSVNNDQTQLYSYLPDATNHTRGLRADFTYQLGEHQLGIGIDNMYYAAHDQGQTMAGPGHAWIYSHTTDPNAAIDAHLGVPAPGGDGYYVSKYVYSVATSMSMWQKAWYVQDIWNVTDTLQLNLGVRNDHFSNRNDVGVAFVDEKNQWEPRLGFSWDVKGDSSFKVYGNAGRYYLALPDSVAERAANPSYYTNEYFNYTGIDANGVPTGLTPIGPGPVSSDNELGQPKDSRAVTATDLKAQYQDEFILGFDKALGRGWVYGAKGTFRHLRTAIDDVCDVERIADKLKTEGRNPDNYIWDDPGCRIFNPGMTNTFNVEKRDGSGYEKVSMSTADWGFKRGAVRKYYALDLYLEHPFDGKWQGRIDYSFSRSWGNAEGQVRSDFGQTDISKTEDWDAWSLMEHAYGLLANHRRHQLKIRGSYQLTPQWLVSGTLRVQSGTPAECLGFYGTDDSDPISYGSNYHWCDGVPAPPGSTGFTPWTRQLNLGVRYTPAFADHRLAFRLNIFNVLNEQKAIQINPVMESDHTTVSNTYGSGIYFEQPRYVRLSVSYDY